MENKIVNFLEKAKEVDDQVLPIERDSLLKQLQEIKPDIASEYVSGIETSFEEMMFMKNIISSADKPRISKQFIAGLDEDRFKTLEKIVLNLRVSSFEEKIKEIVEATLGYTVYPLPESIPKANELLNQLKGLSGNYETEAQKIADLARYFHMLANILIVMDMGEDLIEFLRNRLSKLPKEDLDRLGRIVNGLYNNL